MSTETDEKVVATEVKAGELLADTDKDLVGSSVMISYSRKGRCETMPMRPRWSMASWREQLRAGGRGGGALRVAANKLCRRTIRHVRIERALKRPHSSAVRLLVPLFALQIRHLSRTFTMHSQSMTATSGWTGR